VQTEIKRALDTLSAVLIDLLDTFNKQTELVDPGAGSSWVRVLRWHRTGGFNPRYEEQAAAFEAHVGLLTDLTFELTRAAGWFCDIIRAELDPTFRLDQGALVLECGPFGDGDTRFIRVAYTEAERRMDPGPYVTLEAFRTVDRFTRDVHTRPPEAKVVSEPEGSGLQALEDALIDEQQSRLGNELRVYRAWQTEADRASLIEVLKLGMQTYLISAAGLRAQVWETHLHLRFSLPGEDMLSISIEEDGGAVKFGYDWAQGVTPLDAFRELDRAMTTFGEHLGPGLFLPTDSIRSAGEALIFAATYRAQRLNLGSQYFQSILEYVDGWFITESGLFPREHPYYFIDKDRLSEMDWEEHVSRKGWSGIHSAMKVARALLGGTAEQA
jgi:hypothetical protein